MQRPTEGLGFFLAGSEGFFELVDDEEEPGGLRVGFERVGDGGGWIGRVGTPKTLASSSSGCSPGRIDRTSHFPGPNKVVFLSQGTRPAKTSDDLPLPDPPITVRNWLCRKCWSISSASRSRPKKGKRSSRANARMPGYGHAGRAGTRGKRPLEQVT